MNRRNFIQAVIGATAVAALAKVVPAKKPITPYLTEIETVPLDWTWTVDANCPPDRIYAFKGPVSIRPTGYRMPFSVNLK